MDTLYLCARVLQYCSNSCGIVYIIYRHCVEYDANSMYLSVDEFMSGQPMFVRLVCMYLRR